MNIQKIKKRAENIWYYHKWKLTAGLCIAVLVLYLSLDLKERHTGDYTIFMMTTRSYGEDSCGWLGKYLARYGVDVDKDGRVTVAIRPVVIQGDISAGEETFSYGDRVQWMKWVTEIRACSSVLYIVDENARKAVEHYYGNFFSEIVAFSECGAFVSCEELEEQVKDSLYMAARSFETMEGIGEEEYARSVKLMEDLENNRISGG